MIRGMKQWCLHKYQGKGFSLVKISQAEITLAFNSQNQQRYLDKALSTGRCVLFKYFVWILYMNFFITLILFMLVPFHSICSVSSSSKNCSMIFRAALKIFRYDILWLDIKTESRKCRVFFTYASLAPWLIDLKKNFHYCHNVN